MRQSGWEWGGRLGHLRLPGQVSQTRGVYRRPVGPAGLLRGAHHHVHPALPRCRPFSSWGHRWCWPWQREAHHFPQYWAHHRFSNKLFITSINIYSRDVPPSPQKDPSERASCQEWIFPRLAKLARPGEQGTVFRLLSTVNDVHITDNSELVQCADDLAGGVGWRGSRRHSGELGSAQEHAGQTTLITNQSQLYHKRKKSPQNSILSLNSKLGDAIVDIKVTPFILVDVGTGLLIGIGGVLILLAGALHFFCKR